MREDLDSRGDEKNGRDSGEENGERMVKRWWGKFYERYGGEKWSENRSEK